MRRLSPIHRSPRRIAAARARAGSSSALMTMFGSIASRPSSVHSAQSRAPVLASRGERGQRFRHATIAALHERALRRVARQPFGCDNRSTSCARSQLGRRRPYRASSSLHDAIDPSQSRRLLELAIDDVVAQVLGDIGALLNHAAVHVDDVECHQARWTDTRGGTVRRSRPRTRRARAPCVRAASCRRPR